MTEVDDLAGWTPVGFRGGPDPGGEWGDLRNYPFNSPFFSHILRRWRSDRGGAGRWSGLDTLQALDSGPSLDPAVIIAHASRSGSTLLARELAALDGGILVSEPTFLERLFVDGIHGEPVRYAKPDVLRRLVRGLGRVRFGTERLFVLKLYSAATRFLPLLRETFPKTPVIWLQRHPREIVQSQLRDRARWTRRAPALKADPYGYILKRQAHLWLAASAHVGADILVMGYSELPEGAWARAAPFMGIAVTGAERRRMAEAARMQSHRLDEVYVRREPDRLPDAVESVVRSSLEPLYAALDRRRAASTGRPQ